MDEEAKVAAAWKALAVASGVVLPHELHQCTDAQCPGTLECRPPSYHPTCTTCGLLGPDRFLDAGPTRGEAVDMGCYHAVTTGFSSEHTPEDVSLVLKARARCLVTHQPLPELQVSHGQKRQREETGEETAKRTRCTLTHIDTGKTTLATVLVTRLQVGDTLLAQAYHLWRRYCNACAAAGMRQVRVTTRTAPAVALYVLEQAGLPYLVGDVSALLPGCTPSSILGGYRKVMRVLRLSPPRLGPRLKALVTRIVRTLNLSSRLQEPAQAIAEGLVAPLLLNPSRDVARRLTPLLLRRKVPRTDLGEWHQHVASHLASAAGAAVFQAHQCLNQSFRAHYRRLGHKTAAQPGQDRGVRFVYPSAMVASLQQAGLRTSKVRFQEFTHLLTPSAQRWQMKSRGILV